jgi:hypothetical protein
MMEIIKAAEHGGNDWRDDCQLLGEEALKTLERMSSRRPPGDD